MKFSVFATLAAFAVAQPASAAIITVTVSGTVSSGFDQSGMFGAANTDLAGSIFSLVEYFDTTMGTLSLNKPTESLAGGIHLNGDPSSPGHGILTINGVAVPQSGNVSSYLLAGSSGSNADIIERSWADHVTIENEISVRASDGTDLRLLDGFHSDCTVAGACVGGFFFSSYHYDTVPGQPQFYYYVDNGTFDIDSYDVSVSGAVPEPATWAMMIAGFGLMGGALRRRRPALPA